MENTLLGDLGLGPRNISVLAVTEANIQLRAVNAVGPALWSDIKTETPSLAIDYFVIALQGQSGAAHTAGGESQFNPPGGLRPTIVGSLGRIVQTQGTTPIDREINNTNFQNVVSDYQINQGVVSVAGFIKFLEPTKVPVIVNLAKSGQSMEGLVRNDLDPDPMSFPEYKATVDHVIANYGDPDALVTMWYGTDEKHINPVHWTGVLADGVTAHIPGRRFDNVVGVPSIANYIMQPPGTTPFLGAFKQGATGPKLTYCIQNGNNIFPTDRQQIIDFMADARFAGMGAGVSYIGISGHVDGTGVLTNGAKALQTLEYMGPAILRALGRTVNQPRILSIVSNSGGTAVTVTVDLPNGGILTTTRAARGMAVPSGVAAVPTYMPDYGFEFLGPTGGDTTRDNLLNTEWTSAITNSGSGVAPNRIGIVTLTKIGTPIATGSRMTYFMGGTGTDTYAAFNDVAQDHQVNHNVLIEEVAAWKQAGVEWPYMGPQVAGMQSMTTLEVGGAPLVPQASLTTTGVTPVAPAGIAVGDRIMLIAVLNGNTAPTAPAGWTTDPVTIGGAGPLGGATRMSFLVCHRVWQAGDVMPTFAAATYVDVHDLGPNFRVGQVLSGFAAGGATATAPAITVPTTTTDGRHMLHVSGTNSSQGGFGSTAGFAPEFARVSNESTRRTTWIKPAPVTVFAAKVTPVALTSSGGGILAVELVRV